MGINNSIMEGDYMRAYLTGCYQGDWREKLKVQLYVDYVDPVGDDGSISILDKLNTDLIVYGISNIKEVPRFYIDLIEDIITSGYLKRTVIIYVTDDILNSNNPLTDNLIRFAERKGVKICAGIDPLSIYLNSLGREYPQGWFKPKVALTATGIRYIYKEIQPVRIVGCTDPKAWYYDKHIGGEFLTIYLGRDRYEIINTGEWLKREDVEVLVIDDRQKKRHFKYLKKNRYR